MKSKPRVAAARSEPVAPTATRHTLWERLVERLVPETGGASLYPLVILFALNLADEFDIQAFSILGPEIRDAFGISTAQLTGIRTAAALPGLLIPFVGILGDRVNRVRMSYIAAAIWGVFAVATGLVPATMVWLLVMVRMGSGTA